MIFFGVSNVIAAAFTGAIAKLTGRLPIMIAIMVIHGAIIIWMRVWVAVEDDYITYGAMAALWGLVDGTWLIQVNCKLKIHQSTYSKHYFKLYSAYYGVLFPGKEEAAFSNFRFFEAIGSVSMYFLNPMLCTSSILMILLILMVIGMIG